MLPVLQPFICHGPNEPNSSAVSRELGRFSEEEVRRRVKEQLKKIGGMEFFDVHFSYLDAETREEFFVGVPEQGGGTLIPDTPLKSGSLHTVTAGANGHPGCIDWCHGSGYIPPMGPSIFHPSKTAGGVYEST